MKRGRNHNYKLAAMSSRGITLIELMIVLVIFSVVMAGLYSSYSVMTKHGIREYKLAQSEMEFQIAKSVIERDIAMAGYGIADVYCASTAANASCFSGLMCGDASHPSYGLCIPVHLRASAGPTLTMMGTALGRESRSSQAWSITDSSTPDATSDFKEWSDAREQLVDNIDPADTDKILYFDPNRKQLLYHDDANGVTGKNWLFPYPGGASTNPYPAMGEDGMLVLGLTSAETSSVPYSVVQYSLGGSVPSNCQSDTSNLLRSEIRAATPGTGQPLMNCVLDFRVALGLNTDEDTAGTIDCWDADGAACAAGYSNETLRKQLKQVKVYILAQEGNKDPNYTHGESSIRVGDINLSRCVFSGTTCTAGAGGVGQNASITGDKLHYRWKLLTLGITPRNIR